MTIIISALFNIFIFFPTYAQRASSNILTIGDKVPDFQFHEMMNYSSPTARLSNFKANLTILDFWSTSCSTCVALFPHMQSLKQQFGDRLQIVLVNGKTQIWHDTQQKIRNLLRTQKERTGTTMTLPIVLNSTEADSAFPFQTIPHEVWINSKGEIVGITGAEEVNQENISTLLSGQRIKMHLKRDALFDISKTPLQEWLYGPSDSLHIPIYTSTIWKGFIDGLNGTGIRSAGSEFPGMIKGWYTMNTSLFYLITASFSDLIRVPENQIVVESADAVKFSKEYPSDSSLYSKVYCYDLSLPPTPAALVNKYVQQDLIRAFHFSVSTEKRNLKCLVVRVGKIKLSAPSEPTESAFDKIDKKKYVRNYPINEIISLLNEHSDIPILNETNMAGNMNMNLPDDMNDVNAIKSSLEAAGFQVTEEERNLSVALIKDLSQ